MQNSALCWKCGASLAQLSLPLMRQDVCKQCGTDLHVCKLCSFYDLAVAKHCRETIAEEVSDKQRANFCDYFVLNQHAFKPAASSVITKSALENLFGGNSAAPKDSAASVNEARNALDSLFKK